MGIFKHSEAPWGITPSAGTIRDKNNDIVAQPFVPTNFVRKGEGELLFLYNARLMASAPALLEEMVHAYRLISSIITCLCVNNEDAELRQCEQKWRRIIEGASGMKIEEVLEATARQEVER